MRQVLKKYLHHKNQLSNLYLSHYILCEVQIFATIVFRCDMLLLLCPIGLDLLLVCLLAIELSVCSFFHPISRSYSLVKFGYSFIDVFAFIWLSMADKINFIVGSHKMLCWSCDFQHRSV